VVCAIVAVIGAGVWLGRTLTSGTDQNTGSENPHTLGAAVGSGAPTAGSELTEPTGGDVIVQDSLSRPGRWPDNPAANSKVRCFTSDGALRAVRTNRVELGDFRCKGPSDVIDGDFGVEVTTTLQTASSCAAIWFRWHPDEGGEQLRICKSGIAVAEDTPGSRQVLGTFSQARSIPLRTRTRIHLVVRGQTATLWQDNRFAGSVPLPATGPRDGQALLGINVENGDEDPPYSVSFTDVEIRSLTG
jgi:eukaryotic-like serine/threonine-protein kinase